jgi:ATP-dependent helicase/DNAse subunit B
MARLRIEQERDSDRPPGPHDGVLAPPGIRALLAGDGYFGPGHRFSASQFDSYALCPMQFFLQRVLGLQELDDPDEDLQAADLGNLMHRVLANFFRERPPDEARTPLAEANLVAERERLRECLDSVWRDPEARLLMPHRRLAELLRAAVLKDLGKVLDCETSGRTRDKSWLRRWVRECELRYELELLPGDLRVVGRIDRVDELLDTGALRVYDYKSGHCPSSPDIAAGRASQLPLYLCAVREAYPGHELDECGYYQVRGRAKCKTIARGDEIPTLIEAALGHLAQHAAGIRAGVFPPCPTASCPSYCAFRAICRFSRTRMEGKAPLPAPGPSAPPQGGEA